MNNVSDVKTRKKGDLEFLRIVFCIAVVLFHCRKNLQKPKKTDLVVLGLFPHGSLGVEFFFVCSGFLLARSVYRDIKNNDSVNAEIDLGISTAKFIWHKISTFLSQHVVAYIITIISMIVVYSLTFSQSITCIIESLPSLFLINMSGWNINMANNVEWYLSVMLLSFLIIYPLMRKYFNVFIYVIAPALGMAIIGYLYQKYGYLTGVQVWDGLFYKSLLRGFSEICLGAFTFGIVLKRENLPITSRRRLVNTILFVVCFILSIVLMIYTFQREYEVFFVPLSMILVGIAYIGDTYISPIFSNRIVLFLGRFSLSVYLSQVAAIYLVIAFFSKYRLRWQVLAVLFITFIIALVVYYAGHKIDKIAVKKKNTA